MSHSIPEHAYYSFLTRYSVDWMFPNGAHQNHQGMRSGFMLRSEWYKGVAPMKKTGERTIQVEGSTRARVWCVCEGERKTAWLKNEERVQITSPSKAMVRSWCILLIALCRDLIYTLHALWCMARAGAGWRLLGILVENWWWRLCINWHGKMRRVGQAKGVQNGVFQEGEWQVQGPEAERQFQKLRKDEWGAAAGDKV